MVPRERPLTALLGGLLAPLGPELGEVAPEAASLTSQATLRIVAGVHDQLAGRAAAAGLDLEELLALAELPDLIDEVDAAAVAAEVGVEPRAVCRTLRVLCTLLLAGQEPPGRVATAGPTEPGVVTPRWMPACGFEP